MQKRQPVFNAPASVVGTLAVLIVVHAVRSALPEEQGVELLWTLAFVPARYSAALPAIPGGGLADVTSFMTYMLVHGDATHLVVNSVWMLAFGSAVAKRAGNGRFLLFSLACGIAGALTHLALYFGDMRPVVGASAAISGQMAAALRLILGPRVRIASAETNPPSTLPPLGETLRDPRMQVIVGVWTAMNLIFGLGYVSLTEGEAAIAWEAHIGGFAFGLLCFGLFDRSAPPPPEPSEAA